MTDKGYRTGLATISQHIGECQVWEIPKIFTRHSQSFYQTSSSFSKCSQCSLNVLYMLAQSFGNVQNSGDYWGNLWFSWTQKNEGDERLGNIWWTLCYNLGTIWGTFGDIFAKRSLNIRNNRHMRHLLSEQLLNQQIIGEFSDDKVIALR